MKCNFYHYICSVGPNIILYLFQRTKYYNIYYWRNKQYRILCVILIIINNPKTQILCRTNKRSQNDKMKLKFWNLLNWEETPKIFSFTPVGCLSLVTNIILAHFLFCTRHLRRAMHRYSDTLNNYGGITILQTTTYFVLCFYKTKVIIQSGQMIINTWT